MLKFLDGELPRFKEAYAHAVSIGQRDNFICQFQMPQWGKDVNIEIGYDWSPYSFTFAVKHKTTGKMYIFGGIIFHQSAQKWSTHT